MRQKALTITVPAFQEALFPQGYCLLSNLYSNAMHVHVTISKIFNETITSVKLIIMIITGVISDCMTEVTKINSISD